MDSVDFACVGLLFYMFGVSNIRYDSGVTATYRLNILSHNLICYKKVNKKYVIVFVEMVSFVVFIYNNHDAHIRRIFSRCEGMEGCIRATAML